MVAIHNKNGQGLLQHIMAICCPAVVVVAIHNKNGQGLLQEEDVVIAEYEVYDVAIHNKNGQGLLHTIVGLLASNPFLSQSTIKMDKGYYQLPSMLLQLKTQ